MPLFSRRPELLRNGLDAWLMLIASDRPEQILEVIRAYPEFEEIYRQVFGFRRQVKELMSMFSDALKILDANTTKYMIEQQKEKIEQQEKKIERQEEKIKQQREEIERLKARLAFKEDPESDKPL
mgnify:FL=1